MSKVPFYWDKNNNIRFNTCYWKQIDFGDHILSGLDQEKRIYVI